MKEEEFSAFYFQPSLVNIVEGIGDSRACPICTGKSPGVRPRKGVRGIRDAGTCPKLELTPPVDVPITLDVVLVRTGGGAEGVDVIPLWPKPGLADIP